MSEVYNAVVKIFCMFGFPERVKTDNGKEFINFDFHELCKYVAIKHNRTVAYNHHANGVVERQHRTTRATLRKIMLNVGNTSANNWDEFIPAVAFASNARIHSGMKSSPFALMFGRSALNIREHSIINTVDIDSEREKMLQFWKIFKTEVPTTIQELRIRNFQRSTYHRKAGTYKIGDIVRWKSAKPTNVRKDYQGPFVIVDYNSSERKFTIENASHERIIAPANFLKHATDNDGKLAGVYIEPTEEPANDSFHPLSAGEEDTVSENAPVQIALNPELDTEEKKPVTKVITEIRSR
jgi:hypothetical protein